MKINIVCRPNHSGVGRHARFFYQYLRDHPKAPTRVDCIDPDDKNLLAHTILEGTDDDVTIFFVTQNHDLLKLIKGKKILWCAFESTHIPTQLIHLLELFDEIWVPSGWGQVVMIKSGMADTFVKTVPEGVDTSLYFPKPKPHNGFIFLSVAKYEKRKCIDEIIVAYQEEFPRSHYPDVALWLKADFPLFPERIQKLRTQLSYDPRIKILEEFCSDQQMAELYNSADAFLYPSRAEGFGLTGLEAIVCGLPTLAINYSGQTEYLQFIPDLYRPIEYVLEDIVDNDFDYFYKQLYRDEAYGQWAKPSLRSMRQGMRDLYERRDAWREKALMASRIVSPKFDWSKSIEKALVKLGQMA